MIKIIEGAVLMTTITGQLSKSATQLWAKKRTTDGTQLWLPLIVHLIDTEQVINWLFNHWLSQGQIATLTETLDVDEVQKLVKFIGFQHDLGKATPAFQIKRSFDGGASLDAELLERLVRAGFIGLDTLALIASNKSQHAKAGEVLLDKFGVSDSVAAIIGGHHGKPLSETPKQQLKAYTANYWQTDVKSAAWKIWQQVQEELFEFGLHDAGYESVDEIPAVTLPQAVILEGLLIMADWLSSSESLEGTGAPMFPLISVDEDIESINLKSRFQNAIVTWQQGIHPLNPQPVSMQNDPYEARWGFHARPVQQKITEAIDEADDPGMVIVEAPMGLGKTEIALVAAEQLAAKEQRSGLYFGLPTQATSNAMFSRVNDWLNFVRQQQAGNVSVELMHGRRQFNQEFQQLPRASDVEIDGEDADKNTVVVNAWFSGKKTILDDFTVGTIDNLLRLALKQKHLALRHLGLSKKVVVIDEVHAYDAYMDGYLYRALEWLGAYRVPVVVLSATLPKDKRKDLLDSYYRGKFGRKLKNEQADNIDWQNEESYPLVSILDGKKLHQIKDFGDKSKQHRQQIHVDRLNLPDEDLIRHVCKSISHGGVAGVIVNTVKRAQKLTELVPRDIPLMVLHSAFLATDRTKYENQLQAAIGKKGKRPERLIVIGTQVLEQSLDIDFDTLYTDIAPMDLLLQRAGRMHRHQIPRPSTLAEPTLHIMGIENFGEYGKGNEAVYAKYLLMKTDYHLKPAIIFPDDISHLVQQVYDEHVDADVSAIKEELPNFRAKIAQEVQKASAFQIDKPKRSATLHGWLGQSLSQSEQQADASVRDIQETLEVILLQHTEKGDALLDGRSLTACSDIVVAQQLIRLPTVVTHPLDKTITSLEEQTYHHFEKWQDSVWLRGEIAIVLDKNGDYELNGWRLHYSPRFGLSYVVAGE
jgi:CRISPR-associated endonuclease/helicase Cas3